LEMSPFPDVADRSACSSQYSFESSEEQEPLEKGNREYQLEYPSHQSGVRNQINSSELPSCCVLRLSLRLCDFCEPLPQLWRLVLIDTKLAVQPLAALQPTVHLLLPEIPEKSPVSCPVNAAANSHIYLRRILPVRATLFLRWPTAGRGTAEGMVAKFVTRPVTLGV
jgi:hypothetical protein